MPTDTIEIQAVLDLSGFNASLGLLNAGLRGVGNLVKEIGIGAARYVGELGVRAFQRAGQAAFRFAQDVAQAAFENSALAKSFDQVYSGIVDITRTSFAPLVSQLNTLVQQAAPAFLGVVQRGGEWLGKLATDALGYGEAISANFAQGIWDGFSYVVQALTDLGSLIAYWLAPGSPPRILPDLDQWGTDAMNVYLSGWGHADFSIFNQLAAPLTSFIRSLADPLGKGEGIIPQILGTREGIAAAVQELRTTGQVAASTIDKIVAMVGSGDAAVRSYVQSTIALEAANQEAAAAQKQLNDASAAYAALLKPIDATLGRITEEQQQFTEEQEKGRLALTLKDPNATAGAKRQAALRIEQIDAERARRAAVASGEAAVDAAQAQLDAAQAAQVTAQAAFDTDSDRLKLLTEQNELLNSQIKLLESLQEKMAAAAGGGSKGGGGGGGGKFKVDTSWIDDLVSQVQGKLAILQAVWQTAWALLRARMQPVWDFINNELIPLFTDLWEIVSTAGGTAITTLKTWWDETMVPMFKDFWAWSETHILPHFKTMWEWIKTKLPGAIQTLATYFNETLLPAMLEISRWIVETGISAFKKLWEWLETKLPEAGQTFAAKLTEIIKKLGEWRDVNDTVMLAVGQAVMGTVATIVSEIQRAIGVLSTLYDMLTHVPNSGSMPGGTPPGMAPPVYIPGNPHGSSVTNNTTNTSAFNVTVNSSQSAPSIVADLSIANVWAQ